MEDREVDIPLQNVIREMQARVGGVPRAANLQYQENVNCA
jgi:hypothetical protein